MTKRVDFEGFKLDLELPSNIDSEIDKGVWFDKEVSIWIKRYVKPGMVCIDAGANWGLFTLLMARQVGPDGFVYALEPSTMFRKRLVAHLLINLIEQSQVMVYPLALSDIVGQVLCVTEGPPYKSSARIDYERTEMDVDSDEIVRSTTLDTLCIDPMSGVDFRLDFIKIDVDGSEHRLLLGAASTIEQYKPIIVIEVEVSDMGFDATDWLAERGYRFEIYQGKKVGPSYVRDQVGKGVGTVNLLALPEGK